MRNSRSFVPVIGYCSLSANLNQLCQERLPQFLLFSFVFTSRLERILSRSPVPAELLSGSWVLGVCRACPSNRHTHKRFAQGAASQTRWGRSGAELAFRLDYLRSGGQGMRPKKCVWRTSWDLAAGGEKAPVVAATCRLLHKSKERSSVRWPRRGTEVTQWLVPSPTGIDSSRVK